MTAIYPQCSSTDFAALTSGFDLAQYFYQREEQNLKKHMPWFKHLFSTFLFYTKCISLCSSPLFSDIAIASGCFFLYLLFAFGVIDKLSPVMCLLSYKITDDCCLALLLFSLHLLHTEWVVFWPVNTTKEFLLSILLGIPQSRAFLLLMNLQVISWTSAGQRSSYKL